MKNLKLKALSLGIISTVLISSSAFAATNKSNANTQVSVKSVSTIHESFNYGPNGGPSAEDIIDEGGIIQIGDEGNAVHEIQEGLINSGYSVGDDGIFGSQTRAAVQDFQAKHGLTPDGIVGINTLRRLMP